MSDIELADRVRASHRTLEENIIRCREILQAAESDLMTAICAAQSGGLTIRGGFSNSGFDDRKPSESLRSLGAVPHVSRTTEV